MSKRRVLGSARGGVMERVGMRAIGAAQSERMGTSIESWKR